MGAAWLAAALLLAPAFPEGRVVTEVTIDAAGLDESGLRALVELRPGEPASREAVRHAVELLRTASEMSASPRETPSPPAPTRPRR